MPLTEAEPWMAWQPSSQPNKSEICVSGVEHQSTYLSVLVYPMFPAESDPMLKHNRTVSQHQDLAGLYSVKATPAVSSSRLGGTAAPLLGGPRIGSFLSRVPISSRPFHSPLSTKKKG
jgi:hypothetical protein